MTVLDTSWIAPSPLWQPFSRAARAGGGWGNRQRFGLAVTPQRARRELSVGERQRVEILKALYGARAC